MIIESIRLAFSKFKLYFYLFVILAVFVLSVIIGINQAIESNKTNFEKHEPTKFEDIRIYKDMMIK